MNALFRFGALLALTLGLAVPINAQAPSPRPATDDIRISPQLAELVFGVYCAQDPVREEAAPDTASGVINIVPAITDFQFRQTLVPAEIGIGFGVLARAPEGTLFDVVIVTVTHPPYPSNGIEVEQWVTDIDASGLSLMGFSFDSADELVLGQWTFNGQTPDGVELFHVSFEVVEPALVPRVIDTCFDAFLS